MARMDKSLYRSIRKRGVKKSLAQQIAEAAGRGSRTSSRGSQALRGAANDLRSVIADLEDRATGGPAKRKAAARKAAATRKRKAAKRSASARKGARTRAKSR